MTDEIVITAQRKQQDILTAWLERWMGPADNDDGLRDSGGVGGFLFGAITYDPTPPRP